MGFLKKIKKGVSKGVKSVGKGVSKGVKSVGRGIIGKGLKTFVKANANMLLAPTKMAMGLAQPIVSGASGALSPVLGGGMGMLSGILGGGQQQGSENFEPSQSSYSNQNPENSQTLQEIENFEKRKRGLSSTLLSGMLGGGEKPKTNASSLLGY